MNGLFLTTGYSLVDITKTGVISDASKARSQQRNWETLVQVIGLRTQIMLLTPPEIMEVDIGEMNFGKDYSGVHTVWKFKFGVEFEAIFGSGDTPYAILEHDFTNVPIITGLMETAEIITPTFIVAGPRRNIYFESFEI